MTVTLLEGHVVDVLAGLPAGHFHTVVTSPPYLWLRAYGTEGQNWDDGWQGELGQEDTPERYVAHLVAVFRAVRRVLRDDGTLWVNLAGCYFNDPGGQNGASLRNGQGATGQAGGGGQRLKDLHAISQKAVEANRALGRQKRGRHPWLKPLDWVDVPGLFARAMQRDDWTWRSDVVWVKPSALPESVQGTRWERCRVSLRAATLSAEPSKVNTHSGRTSAALAARSHHQSDTAREAAAQMGAEWADCPGCPKCAPTEGYVLRRGSGRPTKTHEHIHLYTKGSGYFYDTEAIRETWADERNGASGARSLPYSDGAGRNDTLGGPDRPGLGVAPAASGRNARDVWVISPEPLKDAHYAAYPSALPERCIKAGTSEWGCCPSCGAPWARCITSRSFQSTSRTNPTPEWGRSGRPPRGPTDLEARPINDAEVTTLGWRPTCPCGAAHPPVPARVLDPFSGSGTTLLAANRLGRDATGIDLKPQYNALARKRLGREPLSLFAWRNEDTTEEVPV